MTLLDAAPVRVARSASWRRDFIAANGGRCHYCNRTGSLECGPGGRPWHIDHKNPLALGGADDDDNLALACKRCNLAKGAKPYKRFVALARATFWVDDESSLSEVELDHLLSLWEDTVSSGSRPAVPNYSAHWRVSDDGARIVRATGSRHPHDLDYVFAAPYGADFSTSNGQEIFVVEAHRMVPHLIAEIRLLRGRLAACADEP